MAEEILICTDLDRTLIPNGEAKESPEARARFSTLAARPEITLAYVSGRHLALVQAAIRRYKLPQPQYIIADVGSSIYTFSRDSDDVRPKLWEDWRDVIATDWAGLSHPDIQALFRTLNELRLQEAEKQNEFKLSYYARPEIDYDQLLRTMQKCLEQHAIQARLIWSVDENAQTGLLDILPAQASKYHAIDFMMQQHGFSIEQTVFSGDSGNDMEVLMSPIPAVLVANATDRVKTQARHLAEKKGASDTLYIASGEFMAMNGNYCAGILEGIAHYLPKTADWMRADEGTMT